MLKQIIILLCCTLSVTACASKKYSLGRSPESDRKLKASQRPYNVYGERYEPLQNHDGFVQNGIASWYGKDFHGKSTSTGERYDMYMMTGAHKTLPLGIYVKVRHKDNGREVIVRLNDRGPFVKGRIIDLSFAAAKKLGIDMTGTAPVRIEALGYRNDGTSRNDYNKPAYDRGVFTVQVGSFKEHANALRFSEEMRRLHDFSDVRLTDVNGENFYRVYAGKYATLEAAEKAERNFADQGYPGSFAVALD
jgi:rare lipoprotein A